MECLGPAQHQIVETDGSRLDGCLCIVRQSQGTTIIIFVYAEGIIGVVGQDTKSGSVICDVRGADGRYYDLKLLELTVVIGSESNKAVANLAVRSRRERRRLEAQAASIAAQLAQL